MQLKQLVKKIGLLILIAVSVPLHSTGSEMQGDGTGSEKLASLLQSVSEYRARFSQQVFDADEVLIDDSSGWVAWQQPGLFRWEVLQPMQQSLLIDEQNYYQYDRDLEQLLVQPLSDEISFLPKLLLSGSAEAIESSFSVSLVSDSANETTYRLSPKSADAIFKQVELVFNQQSLLIMQVFDELDQKTRFEFDPTVSADLFPNAAALFHLEPQPGTDVIYQ